MEQIKKQRDSNFELLRIVSMLLVLLNHYTPIRIADTNRDVLLSDCLLQDIINFELMSLSFVCVNCFILISGYFGVKLKLRSFLNLLFQMVFWSAVCVVFAVSIFDVHELPLLKAFAKNIVCGWFPQAYLILFAVSPILNTFIKSCSERDLGRYILLFYLVSTIGGYLMGWDNFKDGMSALSLMGLYLIGAYLRISTLKLFAFKARTDLLIYLGLGFCMVALNMLMIKVGISSSPYGYLNPIVIIMSVYLFLFFKKINIGHNKVINFLSASAFSIYLFHYNPLCFGKICEVWTWINLNFGVISSLCVAFLSFIAIYLFCVAIDRIRIFLFTHCIERFFYN
ncbi:MAG: acyltransferase family protein [Alistipes sp.]|nr:acyltransferase family protein [Alistipes sp.]